MLRPGFEPESSARKAEMIGRTTPPEQMHIKVFSNMGPMGFEPMAFRLWAGRSTWLSYGPKSAVDRARTCDQSVNSRTLYLLSYDGMMTPNSLNQIKPMFKNQKTLNSTIFYVFTSI